ncbi:hypothetical protein ABZ791_07995 [Streptomyces huasconensis]|uniref:Uncharacterized protein n=1 Tax=Streptomyces huasconensis TaxID=1854574 RepID=A0ABV3M7K5_9ACTN
MEITEFGSSVVNGFEAITLMPSRDCRHSSVTRHYARTPVSSYEDLSSMLVATLASDSPRNIDVVLEGTQAGRSSGIIENYDVQYVSYLGRFHVE